MHPFYYRATTNFGDHMNSWIWQDVAPEIVKDETDGTRLIGIGSLLSRNLDLLNGRKVVFGTGSGYSSPPTREQASSWKIYCVRGPLTAELLGLSPDKAITDAAWLVNRVPRFANLKSKSNGTVFVPHWTSARYGVWANVCKDAGIRYVDPFSPCEDVFSDIANAEIAIVESLHGAIMADFYRTPWVPVVSPKRILKFKWLDWCQSLDLEYSPFLLPPSDLVDGLFQGIRSHQISTDLQLMKIVPDAYDIVETTPPPKKANLIYRAKTNAKTIARNVRSRSLDHLMNVRSHIRPDWNAYHREALVKYFRELQRQRPVLSGNSTREERIDRLNARLDALRLDFAEGRS